MVEHQGSPMYSKGLTKIARPQKGAGSGHLGRGSLCCHVRCKTRPENLLSKSQDKETPLRQHRSKQLGDSAIHREKMRDRNVRVIYFCITNGALQACRETRGFPLHVQTSGTNVAPWTDNTEIHREKDRIQRTTPGLCQMVNAPTCGFFNQTKTST